MNIISRFESIKSRSVNFSTEEFLKEVLDEFADRIALASSFSAEDQVLTDMLCKTIDKPRIFTLDTGRLSNETYEVIERTRQKYSIDIKVMFPNFKEVEDMVNEYGPNLFYDSVENRKLCCNIRKVEPLKRALKELDAWICGLRTEQSPTRQKLERIEWDEKFNMMKVNPLADWTQQQVWQYIENNKVPFNKLHDEGYPSIGCAPCTRAIKPGEDIRAGRWWWEQPEHKECGLHLHKEDSKRVNK